MVHKMNEEVKSAESWNKIKSSSVKYSKFQTWHCPFSAKKKQIYTSDEDSDVETKKAKKLERAKMVESDSDSAK